MEKDEELVEKMNSTKIEEALSEEEEIEETPKLSKKARKRQKQREKELQEAQAALIEEESSNDPLCEGDRQGDHDILAKFDDKNITGVGL